MPPTDQRQPCVLIAFAAPREGVAIHSGLAARASPGFPLWRAVAVAPGFEMVRTGVGPAAAAGGVARSLDPARHTVVISLGVGGALPGPNAPEIGSVVLATRSAFADLGLQTPEGYQSLREMGLGIEASGSGESYTPDSRLAERLMPLADRRAPVATVSTCSGTDARAAAVAERLGPDSEGGVEGMEGASVGLVAEMLGAEMARGLGGVAFAEMRVISNTTGDRSAQRWDLDGALARLEVVARGLGGLGLTSA
ncbi:MAG: futalosine hydrolase [Phycisphaerales bacterium]